MLAGQRLGSELCEKLLHCLVILCRLDDNRLDVFQSEELLLDMLFNGRWNISSRSAVLFRSECAVSRFLEIPNIK